MRLLKVSLLSLLVALPCIAQSSQAPNNNGDDSVLPRAAQSVISLQNKMRDPDSFVLEKISRNVIEPLSPERAKKIGKKQAQAYAATVGTEIFCLQFRSRNGYGGMDRAIAQARGGNQPVVFDANIAELVYPHGCGGEDLTARLLDWTAKQK
jgi:hypothetical protein